jgi:hypothetical protein
MFAAQTKTNNRKENEKTFFKAFLFTLENYLRNEEKKIKVPVPLRTFFCTFDIKKIF